MTVVTLEEFEPEPTMATEHTDHCASTVREWVRVGRALRAPRASAEAFSKGELSYSKVRAPTRIATPRPEPIPTAPSAGRSRYRHSPGARYRPQSTRR